MVSANGTANGIVWVTENSAAHAVLHAYDAADLSRELYNSGTAAGSRDVGPQPMKFASPVVAAGMVFVAGSDSLVIYGLLP